MTSSFWDRKGMCQVSGRLVEKCDRRGADRDALTDRTINAYKCKRAAQVQTPVRIFAV